MIYCLISDTGSREAFKSAPESKIIYKITSPEELLPEEIKKYIDQTKNEKVRVERLSAYTSLLCGLRAFYKVDSFSLKRTAEGKPYIAIDKNSGTDIQSEENKIYISISHSNGLCAVALSDDGEIGIDVQEEVASKIANRLDERFLSDLSYNEDDVSFKIYRCTVSDNEWQIEENGLPIKEIQNEKNGEKDNQIFSIKWVFAESCMKLLGGGFSDLGKIKNERENILSTTKKIQLETDFYFAISIKK